MWTIEVYRSLLLLGKSLNGYGHELLVSVREGFKIALPAAT